MSQGRQSIRLTVDEIEIDQDGVEIAVLVTDDGQQVTIPRELLPAGARVNSVVTMYFEHEPDETDDRRSRIAELQRRLFGET